VANSDAFFSSKYGNIDTFFWQHRHIWIFYFFVSTVRKIKIHQEKTLGGGGGGGGGATLVGTYMSLQQQTNFQNAKKENCIEPG
jgi:hypothetical protein